MGSGSNTGTQKTSIVGPVVGAVVGGLLFIALVLAGVLFWRKRKRQQQNAPYYDKDYVEAQPFGTSGNVVSYTDLTLTGGSQPRTDIESATVVRPGLPPSLRDEQEHSSGLSAKAREAMMGARFTTNPTPSTTYPSPPASNSAYSSSGAPSSREPPTEAGSPLSHSDVQGLRMEVENLRRVMQEIQAERVEAPPSYAD